jgi:hypothetical protein
VNRNCCEQGQALIMVTLGMVFLFLILGLVIDLGYGYYLKQVAQASVDSAVTAAAVMAKNAGGTCGTGGVLCQSATTCSASPTNPPETDFDTACLYARTNGIANQTVTVSAGTGVPPSNSGVNVNYWITATASLSYPLTFLGIAGFHTATVTAQATGGLAGNASGGGCIYVLDPTGGAAFNAVGTSTVQANGGIYVNSSASDAMTVKGTANVSAAVVNVVGDVKQTGGATITPRPTTGVSPVSDPFASLPSPTFGGCSQTDAHYTGGTINLSPGVYCGGIQASGQSVLNFAPGTYILNGGGMQITSANVTLNGSGVFFYNTSSGYSFSGVTVAGGATLNLSAPTSGTYKGILLFQDRNITSSATSAFGGSATERLSGTVYMPTGSFKFAGGNDSNLLTMALVVKDLDIVGNAFLNKDSTGDLTGLVQTTVQLLQ